ncbi:IS66 family insertion sequence element accessory protein TnpB [Sansalvadorimonas verongulae]|uniref:IS66 family insertion sequence element accessory protein TnpB n=1 Tax=Sansalvadorimonas verongulae TaxID=2172824 RepID=UPI0012BC6D2D|nr:IS66 family insertion sequence element accessory protein TnpB [Sansalvadorimonas verongulae]MTI12843.1 transposase [Sansalvadorimonas verongulae]
MIATSSSLRVYLAPGATDMRKSIDGLALIVSEVLVLNPFSESLFVFSNRGRNKLKILHWQTNGFWLYYRRLEKGRFHWPRQGDSEQAISLTQRELNWLLDGLPIEQKKAHQPLSYQSMI